MGASNTCNKNNTKVIQFSELIKYGNELSASNIINDNRYNKRYPAISSSKDLEIQCRKKGEGQKKILLPYKAIYNKFPRI